jgi:hypothetical protein
LHFSLAGRDKEEKLWEDREMAFSHLTNFLLEPHGGKCPIQQGKNLILLCRGDIEQEAYQHPVVYQSRGVSASCGLPISNTTASSWFEIYEQKTFAI